MSHFYAVKMLLSCTSSIRKCYCKTAFYWFYSIFSSNRQIFKFQKWKLGSHCESGYQLSCAKTVFKLSHFSLVTGLYPESTLAKSQIFPQKNKFLVGPYTLGIMFKSCEGLFESAPQLTHQLYLILQGVSPGKKSLNRFSTASAIYYDFQ